MIWPVKMEEEDAVSSKAEYPGQVLMQANGSCNLNSALTFENDGLEFRVCMGEPTSFANSLG